MGRASFVILTFRGENGEWLSCLPKVPQSEVCRIGASLIILTPSVGPLPFYPSAFLLGLINNGGLLGTELTAGRRCLAKKGCCLGGPVVCLQMRLTPQSILSFRDRNGQKRTVSKMLLCEVTVPGSNIAFNIQNSTQRTDVYC